MCMYRCGYLHLQTKPIDIMIYISSFSRVQWHIWIYIYIIYIIYILYIYIYIYYIYYIYYYIYYYYIYIHRKSNLSLAIHLLPAGTSLPGTFEGSLQPLWSWQERSGRLAGAGQGRFNADFTNKMWNLTRKNGDLTNKCWWYNRR